MDLWDDVIGPLLAAALAVTAIVCFTKLWWGRMDDKRQNAAHAARCASCAAGVYHGHHDGMEQRHG